jgi:hypothetical protein
MPSPPPSPARALREAVGGNVPRSDRLDYEHDLAMVRTQLGEPAFLADWEAGRALSPEAAFALALKETPRTDRPVIAAQSGS